MKAAVVHALGAPLRIDDVAVPTPGPGEVLVKVEASGLCHTDIHAAHGDWPVKPSAALHPRARRRRHRERVGAGSTRVAEGDRVAVPWLGWACGACEYCASGWETLCLHQRNTGYTVDGGYAEYVLGSRRLRRQGPGGHRPARRGPAHLRRRHDLQGRQGLGHAVVRSRGRVRGRRARALGPAVRPHRRGLGRGRRRRRREAAAGQGPRRGVHGQRRHGGPGRGHPGPRRRRRAIALAAAPKPFEQAYGSLRRGGRLVFVGLPADNRMALPIFETVLQGHHGDRLDRRHPRRPGRDVRAPRGRTHAGDP